MKKHIKLILFIIPKYLLKDNDNNFVYIEEFDDYPILI